MDHQGLQRAHIVAHDIGGCVPQQLAVFHPDRITTLTLIDCVSFDSWPSCRTRQQMQNGLDVLTQAPAAQHRAHFCEWIEGAVVGKDRLASTGALDA